MIISAIVATAKGNVIGKDNEIPWYLPADLQYFKRTTLGHHIIMGRNSYESIGRPLPKRVNIILTRNVFFASTGIVVAHSIEEALLVADRNGEEEVFILGGGEIYRQSEPYWDKVYLTEIDLEVAGDVYFPTLQLEEWRLLSREAHAPDEKNEHAYVFKVYERIRSQE